MMVDETKIRLIIALKQNEESVLSTVDNNLFC